jgi:glycosyltransferase involved in cell wall biosynthesis
MTKRLLLISRCPPYPLHLGDRLIVYHLARELQKRGWQIDLLALCRGADDEAHSHEAQQAYAPLFEHVELHAEPPRSPIEIARRLLDRSARFPRSAERSWSPELWRAVENRVKSAHFDAIHVFGGVQVYETVSALGGRRAIITPYESYSLYLRRQIDVTRRDNFLKALPLMLAQQIARRYERFMFTPYAQTTVVSDADRDELLTINPALRIEVIPNGIDLEAYTPPSDPRELNLLLFTGNFEYAPNVDAAIFLAESVFPRIRARVPEARLLLVGNAPPDALRALGNDKIAIIGRVPDLKPHLANAAVYACPLRFGAGIKNKVLEALAMGCPVVATPLSIDGIAARDGHDLLLTDADGNAFAEAVVRVLRDQPLAAQLGANGRRLIEERYTWAQMAARYEGVYGRKVLI